jgi:glutamine amidotransferase
VITIVDYGVGNLASLLNMFEFVGVDAQSSSDAAEIMSASHLVLPGVGAFDRAMGVLAASGLIEPLTIAVQQRKVPVMGVCLGMQLLGKASEEGQLPGLGYLDARCVRIAPPAQSRLKVPNNGWLVTHPVKQSLLFPDTDEFNRFYYNHSYHLVCSDPRDVAADFDYGDRLCCAVQHENIMGIQFHPEKSHQFGMRLLKRFANV